MQVGPFRLRSFSCPDTLALHGSHAPDGELRSLQLQGVQPPTSFSALLGAVLPAGAPLGRLILQDSGLAPACLQRCAQLSTLTCLHLWQRDDSTGSTGPVLHAILHQAPNLVDINLGVPRQEPVPPCLAAQQGLTNLVVQGSCSSDLPRGPYLQRKKSAAFIFSSGCTVHQAQ